jgi:hypothetical protein
MTTALSIVNRAAELIGYKDPDDTLSGNEAASFLEALNSMVDEWNTRRLAIVSTQDVVTSVSASPATIGNGATINTPRPVRISSGFVRIDSIDYPIEWLTGQQFHAISDKATAGSIPCYGHYEPSLPTGSVYLWPAPSGAVSLHLIVETQLSEFADLATEYDLAPGYRKALAYSLAEELAPGRRPLDPQISRKAASARRAIKTVNASVPQLDSRVEASNGATSYSSIESGAF